MLIIDRGTLMTIWYSQLPAVVLVSRKFMRDRGSFTGTDGQKPVSRCRSVRVGRTTRIIIVTRVILLIWGASARKIDDQEASAMMIKRVRDTVPEEVHKLPSSPDRSVRELWEIG